MLRDHLHNETEQLLVCADLSSELFYRSRARRFSINHLSFVCTPHFSDKLTTAGVTGIRLAGSSGTRARSLLHSSGTTLGAYLSIEPLSGIKGINIFLGLIRIQITTPAGTRPSLPDQSTAMTVK